MMYRYARVDPTAPVPQQVLGIIECDTPQQGPGLVPIQALQVSEASWYWAAAAAWVPDRPSAGHEWTGSGWTLNNDLQAVLMAQQLAARYQQKVAEINYACEVAITAGFTSDALGSTFGYDSQLEDQINLTGAVLRGLDMDFPCRDEQGIKVFRLHTIAQLNQVSADFTLFKLQLLQRADQLKQLLGQALANNDASALEAIIWEASLP